MRLPAYTVVADALCITRVWSALGALLTFAALALCSRAHAQTGVRALPAVWLTPQLEGPRDEVRLALGGGYGVTEKVVQPGGLHHRLQGSAALAASSKLGLAAELRFDGRYDIHDVPGGDDSLVGEPRLLVRYARALPRHVFVGTEVGVFVPGAHAPSLRWSAATLDALGVVQWRASSGWSLTAAVGGRYDRSARSVDPHVELSPSDRISLGVSSYDAILSRVALGYHARTRRIDLELSSDLGVGHGAPRALQSPLRAAVVFGQALPTRRPMELIVIASCLLSQRPTLLPTLQRPFEPRAWLSVGLTWSFARRAPQVAAAPAPIEAPVAEVRDEGALEVVVNDEAGQPLTDTHVTLAGARDAWTASDGAARISGLAPGAYELKLEANGFRALQRTAEVQGGTTTPLHATLQRKSDAGLLRLQVRDAVTAQPVAAQVLIVSTGRRRKLNRERTATSAQGTLERELGPGTYRITTSAPGYRLQTRKMALLHDVSVFLVDLLPERR